MQSYIVIEILGVNFHYYICSFTFNGDNTLSGSYSHPRAAQVRTHSGWESESCECVKFCLIQGIRDVINKVGGPIRHIYLNDMVVEGACRI